MNYLFALTCVLFVSLFASAKVCPSGRFTIALHGGAGDWQVTEAQKKKYRAKVEEALMAGHALLKQGASSIDAVQRTVQVLEDSGILNAGKGAVRNLDGVVELDASLMDGATSKAGAVGAVKTLKNPVHAARLVMDRTKHVLLIGSGAEKFSAAQGAEVVDPSYFERDETWHVSHKYGTVGAVALDCHGNLAAATSTGGLRGKMPGRVGDSPIIGAGSFAKNETCAVSSTGVGEFFIRGVVAYDISAMMEYQGKPLTQAAADVIAKLGHAGGEGGIISVDRRGEFVARFNTKGMLRGMVAEDGVVKVEF